mmetsp:Transcript_29688/g.78758  ORF Transcript_29688/g.78758 Transcript_29688/m.78758 type:complete len:202 (+) Transcript_29688:649-1254(+)
MTANKAKNTTKAATERQWNPGFQEGSRGLSTVGSSVSADRATLPQCTRTGGMTTTGASGLGTPITFTRTGDAGRGLGILDVGISHMLPHSRGRKFPKAFGFQSTMCLCCGATENSSEDKSFSDLATTVAGLEPLGARCSLSTLGNSGGAEHLSDGGTDLSTISGSLHAGLLVLSLGVLALEGVDCKGASVTCVARGAAHFR